MLHNRREFLKWMGQISPLVYLSAMPGCSGGSINSERNSKPYNVLFIAVDDMRDWTEGLKGYGGKVYTPNQDRLAEMGIEFTNAHTSSPCCAPSRMAILSGRRPSTTGCYLNAHWLHPHRPELVTLPYLFKQNGYTTFAAGKVYHHTPGFNPPYQWDEHYDLEFKDEYDKDGNLIFPPPKVGGGLAGLPWKTRMDWGTLDRPESEYEDFITVDRSIEFLNRDHSKPFFLACGIYRPHIPWYVPKRYVDMYPLEEIKLPEVPENEMDDIPAEGQQMTDRGKKDWNQIRKTGHWKEAVQHYLACITFADAQLGRMLDAFEKSPYTENTVLVFWSDHGWHLGQKHTWHKWTLWEDSTRVPFYISVPGWPRSRSSSQAVSLIDIYPTLVDICRLSPRVELDGQSLVPLLRNPHARRQQPAIIEYKRGQVAVRTERWRYIRYAEGSEELYDHEEDPNEWTNLAGNPKYQAVKQSLAQQATKTWAPEAPDKSSYRFNEDDYVWENLETGKKSDGRVPGI